MIVGKIEHGLERGFVTVGSRQCLDMIVGKIELGLERGFVCCLLITDSL